MPVYNGQEYEGRASLNSSYANAVTLKFTTAGAVTPTPTPIPTNTPIPTPTPTPKPYVPPVPQVTPPVLGIQDMICLGDFPGCPDIFLFIIPTGLVILVLKKAPKKLSAAALGAIWLASFIILGVMLQVDGLRIFGYVAAAAGAGAAALALRR